MTSGALEALTLITTGCIGHLCSSYAFSINSSRISVGYSLSGCFEPMLKFELTVGKCKSSAFVLVQGKGYEVDTLHKSESKTRIGSSQEAGFLQGLGRMDSDVVDCCWVSRERSLGISAYVCNVRQRARFARASQLSIKTTICKQWLRGRAGLLKVQTPAGCVCVLPSPPPPPGPLPSCPPTV